MLQTKIMEIEEKDREKLIRAFEAFGWHVLSTQKVDYTTTYTTGGGNARDGYNFTVHNDRTAYYSITFQRDSEKVNHKKEQCYNKYVRNQEEMAKISSRIYQLEASKKNKWWLIIFGIILFFWIVGIVMVVIGAKKISQANGEIAALRQKRASLETQNNSLVNEARNIKD